MCFEALGLWLLMAPTRKKKKVSASGFKLELQLFYNFLLQMHIYTLYSYSK